MNRVILSVLFAAGQCAAAAAQTAGAPCLQPKEWAAFEIVTLKNTLMVAALSCGQDDLYNDVMSRFRPFMQSQQSVVDSYFQRVNGDGARQQEDGFMTQLSNDASQEGQTLGDTYCGAAASLYDAVLSVPDASALQALADQNGPAQGGPDVCGTQTATAAPVPDAENQETDEQAAVTPPGAPVSAPPPVHDQTPNLAAEMPPPAPAAPAPSPRIVTNWTPPPPLAAVPLPGSSPLAAAHQPAKPLRKPAHPVYASAHHPAPAAKPHAKPMVTLIQV